MPVGLDRLACGGIYGARSFGGSVTLAPIAALTLFVLEVASASSHAIPVVQAPGSHEEYTHHQQHIQELRKTLASVKVAALVFYGRRDRFKILNTYLERNLLAAGGILREVLIFNRTSNPEDIMFLNRLVACHQGVYRIIAQSGPDLQYVYRLLPHDHLYVKIDDDIVFIQLSAIISLGGSYIYPELKVTTNPEILRVSGSASRPLDEARCLCPQLDRGSVTPLTYPSGGLSDVLESGRARGRVTVAQKTVVHLDGSIELLVKAKIAGTEYAAVSANVVNHPVLSEVHAHLQAIMPFAPTENASLWCDPNFTFDECHARHLRLGPCKGRECEWTLIHGPDGEPALLDDTTASWLKEGCFVGDWRCAALAHYSFLHRWKAGSLHAFAFSTWDFSFPDFRTRWSVNFFVFNASLTPPKEEFLNHDGNEDEVTLGMLQPSKLRLHCTAIGHTLVVHFGYRPQNRWLEHYTNLIKEYEMVAKQHNLAQIKTHYNSSESCSELYAF